MPLVWYLEDSERGWVHFDSALCGAGWTAPIPPTFSATGLCVGCGPTGHRHPRRCSPPSPLLNAIPTCTSESSPTLSDAPHFAQYAESFLPLLRPCPYSPSAGDRGALAGGGAGHLLPLPAATALPAVCEVEWVCPPGHVCDAESSTKVLIDYGTGARSPRDTAFMDSRLTFSLVPSLWLICRYCAKRGPLRAVVAASRVRVGATARLLALQHVHCVQHPPHTRGRAPSQWQTV